MGFNSAFKGLIRHRFQMNLYISLITTAITCISEHNSTCTCVELYSFIQSTWDTFNYLLYRSFYEVAGAVLYLSETQVWMKRAKFVGRQFQLQMCFHVKLVMLIRFQGNKRKTSLLKRVRKNAKIDWVSSYLSVCPHRTVRLQPDGFSWNLVFEYFSKICRENAAFIKIWQ
jgi:hypothetical protein